MDLADDDGRTVGRGRKWPARKAGAESQSDAHPGEPDPGCADEELPGQEHRHTGRHVVPRDDGAVHIRGVVADEHRQGIGLGKGAGPRPGGRDTDAADDQECADESVKHGAARLGSSSGPRAGRGAFQQGYLQTGATSPTAGGDGTPGGTLGGTPPHLPNRASGEKGGVAPVLSLSAGAVRERRARTKNTNNDSAKTTGGVVHPPRCSWYTPRSVCVPFCSTPAVTPERSRRRGTMARIRTMPPRD